MIARELEPQRCCFAALLQLSAGKRHGQGSGVVIRVAVLERMGDHGRHAGKIRDQPIDDVGQAVQHLLVRQTIAAPIRTRGTQRFQGTLDFGLACGGIALPIREAFALGVDEVARRAVGELDQP